MKHLLPLIVFLTIFGCSKNEISDLETFSGIKGQLIYKGQGLGETIVSLSNKEKTYTATTSDNGDYSFLDIEKGNYTLHSLFNINAEGLFVEKSAKVDVTNQGQTLNLVLPNPVLLETGSITNHSIGLVWSKSDSDIFREYKIYRAYSSALDETTGELIHVATNKADTTFTDGGMAEFGGLQASSNYYYRVYAMDQYGSIGGSNIIKVTTTEFENEINTYYELIPIINFAAQHQIRGIASDDKHLWILYLKPIGGYYDDNEITLIKYDYQNGQTLQAYTYTDRHETPYGIAFDGTNIWIYFDATAGDNGLWKVNTTTGQLTKQFFNEYGVEDISYFEGELYLSYYYNRIEKINPINGAIVHQFNNPFGTGANYGIAVRKNEIWLTSRDNNKIAILNAEGTHFALANYNGVAPTIAEGLQMCFLGNQLVLANSSRVYIYDLKAQTKKQFP